MVEFRSYQPADFETVMALLDANTPEAFAPNERPKFEAFLGRTGSAYRVAFDGGRAVASYSLSQVEECRGVINWLMAHPDAHGTGLGRQMMEEIRDQAHAEGLSIVDIGASHVSEAFYAKFGATVLTRTADGWGPGMHRVDMEWAV